MLHFSIFVFSFFFSLHFPCVFSCIEWKFHSLVFGARLSVYCVLHQEFFFFAFHPQPISTHRHWPCASHKILLHQPLHGKNAMRPKLTQFTELHGTIIKKTTIQTENKLELNDRFVVTYNSVKMAHTKCIRNMENVMHRLMTIHNSIKYVMIFEFFLFIINIFKCGRVCAFLSFVTIIFNLNFKLCLHCY